MSQTISANDVSELRARHLIDTDSLARRIEAADDSIRVVDMRGAVKTRTVAEGVQAAEYCGARAEYDHGHVPGAVYFDWTRDIVDESDPVPAQAAPADKLKRVLESAGIGDEHLVIAYDAHPASQFATRLWWLLRYYGHDRALVLDGGWRKWLAEGRSVSRDAPAFPPARFTPRVRPEWRATADEIAALIGSKSAAIVDARDADQYTGQIRRGPRGGHIPGALHAPREALFQPDGTFKGGEALAAELTDLGVPMDRRVAAYCNGGVAATSLLFALSMLGHRQLTNYDGSWNEWAERPDLPVEVRPRADAAGQGVAG